MFQDRTVTGNKFDSLESPPAVLPKHSAKHQISRGSSCGSAQQSCCFNISVECSQAAGAAAGATSQSFNRCPNDTTPFFLQHRR